jgi:hypothetical protein
MLDVPCGDFNWMRAVDLTGVSYIGGDIVPALISRNLERYARPGVTFRALNAARDPLPKVDLILCRDLAIHLSFASIKRVLANVHASGSTWLAVSTYPGCTTNLNVRTGGYRDVNFQAAPFHLPAPTRLIRDEPGDTDTQHTKYLGVWHIADALDAC